LQLTLPLMLALTIQAMDIMAGAMALVVVLYFN
jgi:hypothetical protein